MLSFGAIFADVFRVAPIVVAGIEYLKNESDSATKQQLALDSLTVLTKAAAIAAPGTEAVDTEINKVLSEIINLTVAGFNASGLFQHKAATVTAS